MLSGIVSQAALVLYPLFGAALRVVAEQELVLPDRDLSHEELEERTERFFSRGSGWIERRLELRRGLAGEIDALGSARNELADGYLQRYSWLHEEHPKQP